MRSNVQGNWYNQNGSLLVLHRRGQSLEGTFNSVAGPSGIRGDARVIGFTSRHLLSFVTHFLEYGSSAAWAGHLVTSGAEALLELQWLMPVGSDIMGRPDGKANSTWAGSETFRRIWQDAQRTDRSCFGAPAAGLHQ